MGFFLRAGFVFAMSLAALTPALADSRLFSVKADAPGVTVEQALVDGKPLAVSGKGGGVTFFRLDSPGDVPCTARVTFVASNGARQDADVALCPQNWNFAVSFAAGSSPPAAAPSPPATAAEAEQPPPAAAPAAPAAETRTITIATDDPQVGIETVFIDRQAATIVNRQGNGVEVEIAGGGSCQRDVGLKLSDGRTIARMMDLCPQSGTVLVMLGSGSEVAGQQPSEPAQPAAPAQPGLPAQPPPPPEEASSPVAEGAWSYAAAAGNAVLSCGVPESDDCTFSAACRLTSGKA
ncbi:MAG: hypothetical protein J0H63_06800, partial [Rhizobiales bacterium]|nr:hypothetical protein [Hyphomicrobiales bacterium]